MEDGHVFDLTWEALKLFSPCLLYTSEVPNGPYNWMGFPPSVQRMLGMMWMAKLLYPETVDYDPVSYTHLFRCLLGLHRSYRGSITIAGRASKSLSPREMAALVAYIPQTLSLIHILLPQRCWHSSSSCRKNGVRARVPSAKSCMTFATSSSLWWKRCV